MIPQATQQNMAMPAPPGGAPMMGQASMGPGQFNQNMNNAVASAGGGASSHVMPPPPGGGMAQPAVMPPPPTYGQAFDDAGNQINAPVPAEQYPQAPGMPPQGPNDPFQNAPPNPVDPAWQAPELGYAPGSGASGGPNAQYKNAKNPGSFNAWDPNEKNQYGGQTIAGADPSQADYNSVQGYADQAYEESQRYMAPQHAQQDRRMQQELLNKGIDPMSENGKEQMKMMKMQQGDQQNAAQFNALQFGQGIQNQMFGQEMQNQQLAGDMQKALWQNQLGSSGQDLQKYLGDQGFALGNAQNQMQASIANMQNQTNRYGQDLNYNLGRSGQDLQRYGMDQNYQLGMGNLDLGRQGQNFNEMMGLDAADFRNNQFNQGQQNWQDQFLYNMMMGNAAPGMGSVAGGNHTNTEAGIAGGFGDMMKGFTGMSDRRLKHNISKVGEIDGINMYSYDYIGEEGSGRIGVMAQEVPWASVVTESGYLGINNRRLWK